MTSPSRFHQAESPQRIQQAQVQKAAFTVSHYTLDVPPSFQPGNLAINLDHMAYMQVDQLSKLVVYNLKDIFAGKSIHPTPIQFPSTDLPTSIRYLNFYGRQLLMITNIQSFYIYNETATELLCHHTETDKSTSIEEQETMFMGSCVGQFSNAQQFILVGSTNFQLVYVVKSNEMGFVVFKGKQFKSRVKQITCVEGLPNKNQVFVCDQEGSAHMFTTLDKEDFNIMKSVNVNTNKMPITCCAILWQANSNFLCCGDMIGRLSLIQLNDFNIYATVSAHARSISGLTSYDNMQQVVTISEDTYLNIWNVKGGQIDLDNSIRMSDSMIFGVGAHDKTLIALTYDTNDITIIKF